MAGRPLGTAWARAGRVDISLFRTRRSRSQTRSRNPGADRKAELTSCDTRPWPSATVREWPLGQPAPGVTATHSRQVFCAFPRPRGEGTRTSTAGVCPGELPAKWPGSLDDRAQADYSPPIGAGLGQVTRQRARSRCQGRNYSKCTHPTGPAPPSSALKSTSHKELQPRQPEPPRAHWGGPEPTRSPGAGSGAHS